MPEAMADDTLANYNIAQKEQNNNTSKENKSIDDLLYGRLQLPATNSDDTLVAYSIAHA